MSHIEMPSPPPRTASADRADTAAQLALAVAGRRRAETELGACQRDLAARCLELEEAKAHLDDRNAALIRMGHDLAIAHDRANAANRARSEFLAAMNHELRTPLNTIIGFSEILENQVLGPIGNDKYLDYVKDIGGSGQHLLGLINDLLALSKIELGESELHEEAIDIASLLDSAMRLVSQRSEIGQVDMRVELQDGIHDLWADRRAVTQVLVNLLSNAVKFNQAGGQVMLKAWCRSEGGFVFQVIDSGIGIALEDIPKALSQLTQVDSDLGRKFEGTGLGLPLAKTLTEQHGGSLDLQSQVGVGTTVTVRFPAKRIVESS